MSYDKKMETFLMMVDFDSKAKNRVYWAQIGFLMKRKKCYREAFMKALEKHPEYIKSAYKPDKISILGEIISKIEQDRELAGKVSRMLMYVTSEIADEVLSKANKRALVAIRDYIELHTALYGDFVYTPRFEKRSLFSLIKENIKERIRWWKLRRMCDKYLKK